jgi:hypothetical protein
MVIAYLTGGGGPGGGGPEGKGSQGPESPALRP